MCFIQIKKKHAQHQIIDNNADNSRNRESSLYINGYSNSNAQSYSRSAFVAADNSAYNYDMDKICKKYFISI